MKLKLNLFPAVPDMEEKIADILQEAVAGRASLVEIAYGTASADVKKRILNFLNKKEIRQLVERGKDPAVGVEVDRLELPAPAHHHVPVFQVVDREPEVVDLLEPEGRAGEQIHDVAQARRRDKWRRFPVPPPGLSGAPAEGF